MGGPRITAQMVEAVRVLKQSKASDVDIAEALGISTHQVLYIRSKYGIGGRYAIYKEES